MQTSELDVQNAQSTFAFHAMLNHIITVKIVHNTRKRKRWKSADFVKHHSKELT